MENYDVIVVGAGPAGAAISIYLGRKGYSVLLLDKASFPRDKICGDGISGKSLRVLKELGLDKQIEATLHSDMYGVIFSSPKGTTINILYPQESGGTSTEGERGGTRMSARSSVSIGVQKNQNETQAKRGDSSGSFTIQTASALRFHQLGTRNPDMLERVLRDYNYDRSTVTR